MKRIALSIGLVLASAWAYSAFSQTNQNVILKKVYDPDHAETYYVGQFLDIKELQVVPGFESINSSFALESIAVMTEEISAISSLLEGVDVYLAIGTWCGDSQSYAPEILNVLTAVGYPLDKLTIIALDREKKGMNNEQITHNIEFVPTVIFYKNGVEIGRFVESPEDSILMDFLHILRK